MNIVRDTTLRAFKHISQKEGYSLWEHKNSDMATIPLFRVEDSWTDSELIKHTLGFIFVAGRLLERADIARELQK